MDHDSDLIDFQGITRLFPLPGVVQFPHSVLPLHIFEPRYRQMMEDALASDHLITIVQLKGKDEIIAPGVRAVETVGCIGKILQHDRLPDGRFNLLLRGVARVKLTEELPSGKLYRVSRAEVIDELEVGASREATVELIRLFRRFLLKTSGQIEPEVARLFEPDMSLGLLTDMLGHALPIPSAVKQALLNEPDAAIRSEILTSLLGIWGRPEAPILTPGGEFPPNFSAN